MHVRLTHCLGMPVIESIHDEVQGALSGILIEPDSGKVEGFFVHSPGLLGTQELYINALDITRWGTRVVVRDSDALAPAEERIRLQPLLADPRTVLGQSIRTEAGATLGKCKDVQFNTDTMHIEWIFPRKWWKWGVALPVSEVLEITEEAIVIRSEKKEQKEPAESTVSIPSLPEIVDPGFSSRSSK